MISVAIITNNEERNIERCLKSVQWADEIVIVDDFSTDRTIEIAKRLNAKIIQTDWMGYAKQKEFAVSQTSNEWVLSLDADEEVTEELKDEILFVIHAKDAKDVYEIPRKSYFLGKWIQHAGWYPGYQLRLMKKTKVKMNHRPVHEGFLAEGEKGKLVHAINHYSYHSLEQYLDKLNDYTSLDVSNKLSSKKKIHWYYMVLNPISAFLRMYFSLSGYKDGFQGFLLAYYSALNVLVLYAKCWEYQNSHLLNEKVPPITSEAVAELRRLSS
jgi:glycosyltransferase involved in cell wall biosynthesis